MVSIDDLDVGGDEAGVTRTSGKERGTCLDLLCLSRQYKETVCFHLPWELCSMLLLLPLVDDVPQIVTSLHNSISNKIVNCEHVMLGHGVWFLCKDQKPQ